LLGEQGIAMGAHSAGNKKPPGGWDSAGGWGFIGKGKYGGARFGDGGTIARFFQQFWPEEEDEARAAVRGG